MLPLWLSIATAAPTELHLWHAYRGEERLALEDIIRDWDEAEPDISVAVLAVPYDGFVSKLEAATPRGNGPDLFIAAHERVGAWSRMGIAAAWPELPQGLHPTTVDALRYEGRVYGLPLAYKCLALFTNTALLPEPPQSTDELLALQGRWAGQGVYPLAYQATEPYFHAPWQHGFGGGVSRGDELKLDLPANAQAYAFARDLLDRGLIPDEATGVLVTTLFNRGLAATVINGPWFLGEIDPKISYRIDPLPVVSATGQPASPFLTVDGVMVSGFSAHPDAARRLAEHLVRADVAVRRAVEGRQAVATLAAYEDPSVGGDRVLAAFRAQLDRTVPLPNRPEMAATWEPMARALRKVMRGAISPEQAGPSAQQAFEIATRPPPEPADPRPWAAVGGLALLGGLGWAGRQLWEQRRAMRGAAYAYGWVAPATLSMGLLVLAPFAVGAGMSLFEHNDGQWTFVGLSNFLDIALSRHGSAWAPLSFWYTLAVTVLWTLANLVLHVGIGVALAMVLREPWVKMRGLFRVLLIIPWAVPNYITALIWKGMFHRQFGAINGLLGWLGLEPVSWMGSFTTAFAANLTTNTWLGFPFMMVVTLGALQSIPRDLEQAAEVDGATGWQRFRHVTLPLLMPALTPAVLLGSVWTFNMFNIIFLVSGGEPDGSTEILISEAYRWAFTRGHRYGYAAAYAVLIFGVLILWSRAANRLAGRKVL